MKTTGSSAEEGVIASPKVKHTIGTNGSKVKHTEVEQIQNILQRQQNFSDKYSHLLLAIVYSEGKMSFSNLPLELQGSVVESTEQTDELFNGLIFENTLVMPSLGFFSFHKVATHPDPWAQALARLLLPVPNPVKNEQDFRFWLDHLCVLDWLIKVKWDSKRKPILPRKGKLFKPRAEFWKAVINLCLEMHPSVKKQFPSAAEWFAEIYAELELDGCSTNQGKAIDLKIFKAENAALRNFTDIQNPFKNKHTSKFIALATGKAGSSDVFRKEYYRPFLTERSALVSLYSSSEYLASKKLDNGEIKIIPSKKRSG